MSDPSGSEDLLDSDNTGIRARAVRMLGDKTSEPGALKRLLERLGVEDDPRVLMELGRALLKHLTEATADRIVGSTFAVRRDATGARRDAAGSMLHEMAAALGWSTEDVTAAVQRHALAQKPVAGSGQHKLPGSGVHRIPRQGSSTRTAAAFSALMDPVDVAREQLDLGNSAAAIAVLHDAIKARHARAHLAAAWLGAVLLAGGQPAQAVEPLALAAREPRPPHADLERVRAYCRTHGLVPLPVALREVRPAADPPPPAATRETVEKARGQLPDRFRDVALIGTGGMGIVFRAHDAKIGREIAIKMVAPDAWSDEHALKRFDAEARALARLSHPSVLRIEEIHSGAVPFFTMELLEGTPLDGLMGTPVPVIVGHMIAVLEALEHCHEAGIVHRDVKPRNIFITRAGEVRLMDFGVVKSAGTSSVTKVGMIVGTPNYMSPEQLLGTRVDRRADIYAFGVTLFQMLTGVLPFRDPGEVLSRAAPNLRDWIDVPPALAQIVDRCLKRSPDNRFETCRELIAALAPFAKQAAAGPSAREVFGIVVAQGLRDPAKTGELIAAVRRLLDISTEVQQEVYREAEERSRGREIPPEELFLLVARCHLDAGGAADALDDLGRVLEISRPRRRELLKQ